MLNVELIQKLDQIVSNFVEIATTTHYSLYTGYISKGFTEDQAFTLVKDYAIHHNNGLRDIACLVNDDPASIEDMEDCIDEDEDEDLYEDEDDD